MTKHPTVKPKEYGKSNATFDLILIFMFFSTDGGVSISYTFDGEHSIATAPHSVQRCTVATQVHVACQQPCKKCTTLQHFNFFLSVEATSYAQIVGHDLGCD